MDSSVIFLFAAIVIVVALIFAIMGVIRKGGHVNVEKYRSKWLAIEQSLSKSTIQTAPLAIINADKLVDAALRERGIGGGTMGERMKTAEALWSRSDALWDAHKLRNRIAHETDTNVSYDQARRALAAYKRALKDLGAI